MNSASTIDIGRQAIRRETRWRAWRGELKGSEYTWAVAFIVPYVMVFLAFVAYPVVAGLWMGSAVRSLLRHTRKGIMPSRTADAPVLPIHAAFRRRKPLRWKLALVPFDVIRP